MTRQAWRLFLAFPLPDSLRRELGTWWQGLGLPESAWRCVPAPQIHLTMRFLGDTAPERVPALVEAVGGLTAGAAGFELALGEPGAFPARGKPRVLHVGLAGELDALASFAGELEAVARQLGYPPETRAFRPHLTLARARRGGGGRLDVADLPGPPALSWTARHLVLYRSELLPSGARHDSLETFELEPPR